MNKQAPTDIHAGESVCASSFLLLLFIDHWPHLVIIRLHIFVQYLCTYLPTYLVTITFLIIKMKGGHITF